MKMSKLTKLSAFLIIFLMIFLALCLSSCEGNTYQYEVTGTYYLEGTDQEFTITETFTWGPNPTVTSAIAEPYWKVTNDGHTLEMHVDWKNNNGHYYWDAKKLIYSGPLKVTPGRITVTKINNIQK